MISQIHFGCPPLMSLRLNYQLRKFNKLCICQLNTSNSCLPESFIELWQKSFLTNNGSFSQPSLEFSFPSARSTVLISKVRSTGLVVFSFPKAFLHQKSADSNFQSEFFTLQIDQHALINIKIQRKKLNSDSQRHKFT